MKYTRFSLNCTRRNLYHRGDSHQLPCYFIHFRIQNLNIKTKKHIFIATFTVHKCMLNILDEKIFISRPNFNGQKSFTGWNKFNNLTVHTFHHAALLLLMISFLLWKFSPFFLIFSLVIWKGYCKPLPTLLEFVFRDFAFPTSHHSLTFDIELV